MTTRSGIALLLALSLCLGACGDPGTPATGGQVPEEQAAKPTKEALVQALRDLMAAVDAGDRDEALTHLVVFPGMQPEDVDRALASFVQRRDISAAGIEILAKEGEFGELDDLFKERGKSWAVRAGVNENHCYALTFDDAEVAGFWNGKAFQLLHLDDVGKLK